MNRKAIYKSVLPVMFIIILLISLYVFVQKMPMQQLKITAATTAKTFDMSGTVSMYCFEQLDSGESYTAVIKFMAVENKSDNLFAHMGKGQYVYLGCNELKVKYEFISLGRFLHLKLTLSAAQTDLKLEDGTPFDVTRYSLRPVLTIEE